MEVQKTKERKAILVDRVYTSSLQKSGTQTAQLRQEVVSTASYPTKQISNSHQDNPFAMDDFGFQKKDYVSTEQRVAFIDVPVGLSADDVLGNLPEKSTLYRVLSNRPIITDSQQYAINSIADVSLDTFANRQIVRYPEGNELAGQIVKDFNGKPQYRAVFYSNTPKEDQDLRNSDSEDFYASVQILAELNSNATVVQAQSAL